MLEPATGGQPPAERPRPQGRLSWLSCVVLVVLIAVAVGMWGLTRSVITDQQQRLLHERAGEVASTLSTSLNDAKSSLSLLAGVPARSGDSAAAFASAADPFLTQGVTTVGVARARGGVVGVIAAVGTGPVTGQQLSGPRASLIERALATRTLVFAVLHDPTGTRLSLAAPEPDGAVAFQESAIDPTRPIASPPGSPYSELDLAVYASAGVDPAQLILTTTSHRLAPGSVDRKTILVGSDKWLLLIASRQPLVGSFAAAVPWMVLAAGLLSALLATTLVEVLARRRRYALAAVHERTGELRLALDQQVRLRHEQRQARDAADQANRAKSEFLSRMSHELRTPLNAIIGFAQLLEMDEVDERRREPVGHILKGGRHLLVLINEVLDLSRIEAGQLQISQESVPLADTAREALDLVGPLAAMRDITLVADMDALAADCHVQADRQRLKQVLLNLLSNAIKYNRIGGRVEMSFAHPSDTRTRITVIDTGTGIAPEQLARVFEPFERLGAELGEIEGTGLGLALSKRLVEAMGGSITLKSEPGQGTTLTIELDSAEAPHADDAAIALIAPPADIIQNAAGGRYRVLYIEDNLSNLTLVQRILERRPAIELIPAMQGTIGLELAHEHHPDLIVLDLHLPGMPGEEVLKRLKADNTTSAIPVIVLSADASPRQIQRLLRLGAEDYLTKPLDVHRFLEVITVSIDTIEQPSPREASTLART
jgi:signal transduction histidine kinase/AmiR/NasT family two-component response regulator